VIEMDGDYIIEKDEIENKSKRELRERWERYCGLEIL
jgi:uncharacterized protein YmfQ (DUF2313 family)